MAGVDVTHFARGWIDLGDERGGETAAFEAMGAGVPFEAGDDFVKGRRCCSKRAEAGLKSGHQQCSGDAFSGDIRNRDDQRASVHCASGGRTRERVVVVAGDRVLRASGEGDIRASDVRGMIGDEPLLNFTRDFQIAFHGDAVGEFERQK